MLETKKKTGRPLDHSDGQLVKAVTVSLSPAAIDRLRQLGGGVVSAGIRKLLNDVKLSGV